MRKSGFVVPLVVVALASTAKCDDFGLVLNSPPVEHITESMLVDANMQINVFDGGAFSVRDGIRKGGGASEVNVHGGTVNVRSIGPDVIVNLFGGSLESDYLGGRLNVSGGDVANGLTAGPNSQLSISGGSVGTFAANGGSSITIIGDSFVLDGQRLDLVQGEPFEITPRDVELSGLYADGSSFRFFLGLTEKADAKVSAMLVPEPTGVALLCLGFIGVIGHDRSRKQVS